MIFGMHFASENGDNNNATQGIYINTETGGRVPPPMTTVGAAQDPATTRAAEKSLSEALRIADEDVIRPEMLGVFMRRKAPLYDALLRNGYHLP